MSRPLMRTHGAMVLPSRATLTLAAPLHELTTPLDYLAKNSRSFRVAAALLRGPERERVARVYAWCRFTDDLVDRASLPVGAAEQLDRWMDRSRAAYIGLPSGVPLVDRVMGEMAERRIPFAYAEELGVGVRSDLRFEPFADLDALRVYTRRVAGTVGCWLTELHGERDPWMLDRAAILGEAMQLTNILRDVGEDWDQGRVYLPLDLLGRNGIEPADIGAMQRGEMPIGLPYQRAIEEMIQVAEAGYRLAWQAIPHLPSSFRRAAAVAARVYEGIHGAIRRNAYDNLRRRAATSPARKLGLAALGLVGRG
jgi:phytoene synthase